jgi:mRNA-degrading endonuclease RelE of RelBE toxin-antitoxin system
MPSNRFDVRLTREAEKDLNRLRSNDRVMRVLRLLEEDPYAGHSLTGSLKGARSLEFSLPGSGAHRAVYYVIEQQAVCLVFIIGSHENIYDRAERRAKAVKRAHQSS